MSTAVSELTVRTPRSVREALAMLREDPRLVPIAGCTDVLVFLNLGKSPAYTQMLTVPEREVPGAIPGNVKVKRVLPFVFITIT